jgi:hypothetical protein
MDDHIPEGDQHEETPQQDTSAEEALAFCAHRKIYLDGKISQLENSIAVFREQKRKLEIDLEFCVE